MQYTEKTHLTSVFLMLLALLLVMSMLVTIPTHHIDAQPNSEPSSIQTEPRASPDSQDTFLTKINLTSSSENLAVNPETNMVYVTHLSNEEGGFPTMSVINGTTNDVVDSVRLGFSTGSYPDVIAVNPMTNKIYVGLSDSSIAEKEKQGHILHVIDGETNKIVDNITDASTDSYDDIAVDSKTNKLYLVQSGKITAIDGDTNTISYNMSLSGHEWGSTPSIAINPEKNTLYVAAILDFNRTEISVINTANNVSLTNITVPRIGDGPSVTGAPPEPDVDVNLRTNKAYVTDDSAKRIFVIDGEANKITKTIINNFTNYPSARLAIDNSTNLIYILNTHVTGNMEVDDEFLRQGKLSVIDGDTDNIVNNFMLEPSEELAINPQTNMIYILSTIPDLITAIAGKKEIVLTDNQNSSVDGETSGIKVEHSPSAIAVNPSTNKIYLTYSGSNRVSVIDGTTDSIVDTIEIEDSHPPTAVDVDPERNRIYLTNGRSLIGIDGDTKKEIFNTTLRGGSPNDLVVDPRNNIIYTLNIENSSFSENSISAINGNAGGEIKNQTLKASTSNSLAFDINRNIIYIPTDWGEIFAIGGIDFTVISDKYRVLDFKYNISISTISGLDNLVVNSDNNMLYGIDNFDRNFLGIDGFTGTVRNSFTITGLVADIAVNSQTNMAYVTDRISNSVLIRNLTSGDVVTQVPVGVNPQALDINPQTNKIYVVNKDSSTLSIIEGHTSKVIAGVAFSINPSNSGYIDCNEPGTIDTNDLTTPSPSPLEQYFYVSSGSECIAKPNGGFEFVSWEENFKDNSTQPLQVSRPASPWDSFALSVSNFPKDNRSLIMKALQDNAVEPEARLKITKFGTFTANFKEAPAPLPPEFWAQMYAVIATVITALFIPSIVGWLKSKRDAKKLNYFHKQVAALYRDGKLDENDIETLDDLRNRIENAYPEGKLNDKHYESLRGKISGLYEEIFRKKIAAIDNSSNSNNPVAKKTIQEQLPQVRSEVELAFSKGKINEKHFDLLNKAILKLDSEHSNNTPHEYGPASLDSSFKRI